MIIKTAKRSFRSVALKASRSKHTPWLCVTMCSHGEFFVRWRFDGRIVSGGDAKIGVPLAREVKRPACVERSPKVSLAEVLV